MSDFLIEVSFEVANKVGGIYAVLESKADEVERRFGDRYMTIGFYDAKKSKYEFEPEDSREFKAIFDDLAKEGIRCYYGRWKISANPKCILIDINEYKSRGNEIKKWLWDNYKIDSLNAGYDFDEPIIWAFAAGKLIQKLAGALNSDMVAQFHEWLSGAALLYLRKSNARIGLVFTTHATMLGRTIAGHGEDLNKMIEDAARKKTVDDKKAYDYGVQAKHQTEKACAHAADVFTTVSKTTADESLFILGKNPDILLLNGLDMKKFPSMEELSYLHRLNKNKIIEFLAAYFNPYYNAILDDPRIIFISGRYEFRNKGIDVFISSLAKLNEQLKKEKFSKDVFVFIFIPADIRGEKLEVLENTLVYKELEHFVEELQDEMKTNIVASLTKGIGLNKKLSDFLSAEKANEIKKLAEIFRARQGQNPPLCAFNLNYDEGSDSILSSLKSSGLLNREEDRIKVIFYPTYLSAADKLLSMGYGDVIVGSSLGVFPSVYEPWGYTPLEAAARGVLTVTTDYSGFGQFILSSAGNDSGIYVLKRKNRSDAAVVAELANFLSDIVHMDKQAIGMKKNQARNTANLADWKILMKNYFDAYELAAKRCKKVIA